MISYYYLLNMKYSKNYILYTFLLLLLVLAIVSFNISIYDEYNTVGIANDKGISLDIPLTNSDAINKGKYLKISHQKYHYKIESISGIEVINYTNYQNYQIRIDESFKENEVLKITFYYHKQKMIKKIINIIF